MTPAPPDRERSKGKGLPPLAWVGIGCGGLLLVVILSVALFIGWGKRTYQNAEEALRDTEETLRDAQETLAEAEVEMERASREAERMAEERSKIPVWVPRYPHVDDESVMYHDPIEGGVEGCFSFNSSASSEELESFYEEQTGAFPTRTSRTAEKDGETRRILEYEGEGKKLQVILVDKDSSQGTPVIVSYEETGPENP